MPEATIVKVKNNEPKIHTIGVSYKTTVGGLGMGVTQIRLMPGVNEVDGGAWSTAKKNPIVRHYIETNVFEELGGSKTGVSSMSVGTSLELIGQTFDRELLRRWRESETREKVVVALDAQIEKATFRPGRDDVDDEGEAAAMDLQPAQPSNAMDGAQVAEQAQASNDPHETPPARPAAKTQQGKRK